MAPAPTVAKTNPKKGSADGGTMLTLDGANFEADATVSVDGVQATVVSATKTRLTVRMPPHAPAVVGITVMNPDAQVAWVPSAFTYEGGAPTISSIAPQHGAVEGGSAVVVSGTGFAPGASVLFDGQAAAITALSSTAMAVIAPAHASGAVNVTVRNGDGQSRHGSQRIHLRRGYAPHHEHHAVYGADRRRYHRHDHRRPLWCRAEGHSGRHRRARRLPARRRR